MLILHRAAWVQQSQVGVHLLNILPLKTHNIASAVLLLRAGKNLPGFKERFGNSVVNTLIISLRSGIRDQIETYNRFKP